VMQPEAILTTDHLNIGYPQPRGVPRTVSAGISVALERGEMVCLLGPNGAGKSTLLRTLGGMQPPLEGGVYLAGCPLADLSARELARRLSVVLTERVDVGELSVYGLVALGRHPHTDWLGRINARDDSVIRWAIEAVGAAPLAHRYVGELSDGERQKVLIARALAQEPDVMLLDEPTAFLDLPHRVEVMRTLRHLARRAGHAVLLSTHDLDLALRSADRIWLMPLEGPVQVGAPEDLVLSGAFQATFHREGIDFDPYTGSFTISGQSAGVIELQGDGIPALWTVRALEREGYYVARERSAAPIRVEVLCHDPRDLRWRIVTPQLSRTASSIHDLLGVLRSVQSAAA